ncbi:hypothetical protein [Clavibacter michiganensis]|uniref:Uncharacterized protein n=1 Tax=Clavibacter michiganensis subsp. insidiosus TaxID=33014 RepID=A0A0D5CIB5_9MICO|nr:hypothetical protein [Clavibacter michiganensis]AJW79007.1 hypothetical protein VO01_07575 [Clavibacter michiganensis subsp. insidiosus]AWF98304.1 hypothetical protein BEH61_07270 [Clavibacter michiganensis subsp. insidiosus]AWG01494.1 hypothetical protein BEH62_07800 [Clavibacter michiganensis subsp. insidiosus]OQJ59973.1 hypothetical protein B5P21_08660 [Clavibacter michiganensis subsp. insidiosus]RII88417.1 hypothetical protein DZF92_03140 [Clavibacter michiganensis subsp. insidiosus]
MPLLLHVYVYREGSYWIVVILAVGAVTQARSTQEIRIMARDCAALVLDVPLERVRIGAVRPLAQGQLALMERVAPLGPVVPGAWRVRRKGWGRKS